jgi:hypothetical protein
MERRRTIDEFAHQPLEAWTPEFPAGRLERVYLHWSGFDYQAVYDAYHYCIAQTLDGDIVVVQTNDLRANMRNVYEQPELPYAAHTYKRNSYSAGLSIMGMQGARPEDFGQYPLTEALIGALCAVAARIVSPYAIPLDAQHVMTHAEAAIEDGYFGTSDEERWDIARLRPESRPLVPQDARDAGDELRRRIRDFMRRA